MTLPDDLRYELRVCAAGYNLDPTDTVRVDELTNAAADRIEELEAANTFLLRKTELQECSWCGYHDTDDGNPPEDGAS